MAAAAGVGVGREGDKEAAAGAVGSRRSSAAADTELWRDPTTPAAGALRAGWGRRVRSEGGRARGGRGRR